MLLSWERETNLHGIFEYFMKLFLPFCSSWPKVDIFHLKHIFGKKQVTLSGTLHRGIQYTYVNDDAKDFILTLYSHSKGLNKSHKWLFYSTNEAI